MSRMNLAFSDSAAAPDHLARLNDEQRSAVMHGGAEPARPLLVIAGAGSGKTNTLAHRVAQLIVNGADPRRILLMTFSRRAASEMTRRAERIVTQVLGAKGATLAGGLEWAGTFHAIGARLLRDYAAHIGLDPAFTIHDRGDSADLMDLVRHELGFSQTEKRFPAKGTCLAIYSRTVNAQAELETMLRRYFPAHVNRERELKRLFGAYVDAKQAASVLDYDDLLLYWAELAGDADLGREIGERFDHILVDEYQDTNRLQATILTGLKPDGRGVTVVGDDAQSIYSFRSAEIRNILDFPALFSPPARIITLERNYRSTQPILSAANAVIGYARERFTKNLRSDRKSGEKPLLVTVRDDAGQADYVCDTILEEREAGLELKQQAVLFRTSHHSARLEIELTHRNIPFVKFGGLKFLEAAHIKDVLALLRFAENPSDRIAGFRILKLLPGIGPSRAEHIMAAMAEAAGAASGMRGLQVPKNASGDWQDLVETYEQLRSGSYAWPADLELARRWYEPHLERLHDDAAVRRADLEQLEQIAAGYPSRERFLTELTLDPPNATSDLAGTPVKDDDYLILSTIHSAKGQEWKNVFVLNCVDGCIPSDLATGTSEEIEEERRLLYVAMTRAKDRLHLITPQRFYTHGQPARGGRHVYASRTRFIADPILEAFEAARYPVAERPEHGSAAGPAVRRDFKSRMRGMWR